MENTKNTKSTKSTILSVTFEIDGKPSKVKLEIPEKKTPEQRKVMIQDFFDSVPLWSKIFSKEYLTSLENKV